MSIKEKLSVLPVNSGCYLMRDSANKVIYVGKAKNLKNRVKSYFTGSHNIKTTKLVSEIRDFEIVITNSEQESLILELNLIKKYRPKYNIVFMDDKTYPYIEITNENPPLVRVIRTKKAKGKVFGPYPNVKSARETARFLQLLFPMGRIEKIPNFYEKIGYDIIPKEEKDYQKHINTISKFLKGDTKEVIKALKRAMEEASNNMMYERALVLKNQIEHISNVTEKQIISLNDYKDRDIVGVSNDESDIAIQILFMRNGKIVDQHQVVFSYVGDSKEYAINYLNQFYENSSLDEILFDYKYFNLDDLIGFKNALLPVKGDKRMIVELASKNASMDLKNYNHIYRNNFEKTSLTLENLKNILKVDSTDLIEVFDNSQLFGTAPISAMIVYENGKFNKKLYRKFHLKTTVNDDYQAMKEVIYRRYQRQLMEKNKLPDLILLDGGKGQVSSAKEVLDELGLNIRIAGLKKNNKHQLEALVFNDEVISLSCHKDVYRLLLSISEEVHRYAISFHRSTRKKKSLTSILDKVIGLGPKRREKILLKYNSLKEIYEASLEELLSLGIPNNVIISIKEVLKDEINN